MSITKLAKLTKVLLGKKHTYGKDNIVLYIRIYTDLVNAWNLIDIPDTCDKAINYLRVVRTSTKEYIPEGEESYFTRIHAIAHDVIQKKAIIKKKVVKERHADPYHAKTKLLLAQNICILRIVKLSS